MDASPHAAGKLAQTLSEQVFTVTQKMNARISEQPGVSARIRDAFPTSPAGDVSAVLELIPTAQHPPTPHDVGPISIAGEQLRIPCRFYSAIPAKLALVNLEPQQHAVLSCIYTRHHSGYVRQEFAGQLINVTHPWVVPFMIQLVGEYVCEIIQQLVDHLPELNHANFAHFATENPQFIALTRHRVISYWNVYYRSQFPRFIDYPGYQIMNAFDLWCQHVSPRLLSR